MFEIVHKTESLDYTMPPHTHDNIEIYLCLTDLSNVVLGSRMFPFSKNTLLVIPPDCIHKMVSTGQKYERYILTVNAAWFRELLTNEDRERFSYFFDPGQPQIKVLSEERKDYFIERFKSLRKASKENTLKSYRILFEILENVQSEVGEKEESYETGSLSAPAQAVSKMISYIDEHLTENITTEDIANKLYLNHDYAARIFKKHMNTTVINFVTLQCMILAKRLLSEGNTISETYLLVGYNSYEHFSRVFKKMTGITPGEYRKASRTESVNESGNGLI